MLTFDPLSFLDFDWQTLLLSGVNWKEAQWKQSGPVWLPPETTTSTPTPMKTFLFIVANSFRTWLKG
jgi:hypothetical protein